METYQTPLLLQQIPTRRRSRALVVAAIVAGAVLLIALCAYLGLSDYMYRSSTPSWSAAGNGRLMTSLPPSLDVKPVSDPSALLKVSEDEARKINAAIPISTAPNPTARGLTIPIGNGQSWLRGLNCLTAAVYYEAASESDDGMRAVAQVVLNRVKHTAWPATICGVVFEGSQRATGCQFSFTCDGSMARAPVPAIWQRSRRIADAAMSGYVYAPVGLSTHYHTSYVTPYWAPNLVKTAVIGAHIFYRWPGQWGQQAAFTQPYVSDEPGMGGKPLDQTLLNGEGAGLGGAMQEDYISTERPVLSIGGAAVGDSLEGGSGPNAARNPLTDRTPREAPPPLPAKTSGRPVSVGERWIIGGPQAPGRTVPEPQAPAPPAPAAAKPATPR